MRWPAHTLNALQALLLVGAYVLHLLSKKSMGVARHLVYLNNKWQSALNLELVFGILLGLLAVCACWQLLRLRRQSRAWRQSRPWLVLILLLLLAALFSLRFTPSGLRAYYQLLCFFLAVLMIQCGKGFVLNHSWKKEKHK